MQAKIPAVLMRGGTSKGLFFHENHLPSDPAVRDRIILAAYGSPDPYRRQMKDRRGRLRQQQNCHHPPVGRPDL